MKIALLSNVSVEVLAGLVRKSHEVWLAPGFNAWMEMALAAPEELKAFEPDVVFLLLDESHAAVDPALVERAKASLETALPNALVIVPDLADLAAESKDFFDERMWCLAAMPWSLDGLEEIAAEINRLCHLATQGGAKKVLALDFDNTLWEGVLGEDGAEGIRPRVEFQRAVSRLKERGIVLVGLSKNNPADVEACWRNPAMVLKAEDFTLLYLNWEDKFANLAAAAEKLNLGREAFVFLDDNPAERAQMKARWPEVTVPEWPVDLHHIGRLYFPELRVTAEDANRVALYRAESAREEMRAGMESLTDYLRELKLWASVRLAREGDFARVAQLSQKTNQFNVCTHRYGVKEIADFAADPAGRLFVAQAGDKFGPQGLVAFVLVRLKGPEAEIVDWVMSCRAMNRRLEFAIEESVEGTLVAEGIERLTASWHRTPKNAPVARLFESLGFTLLSETADDKRYRLSLPRSQPLTHPVALT